MAPSKLDEQVAFLVGPTDDGGPPVLLLGITDGAWERMKRGESHNFDLTRAGLPLRIIMFGGGDHDAMMKPLMDYAKQQNMPVLDERRRDFSFRDPKKG